MNSTSPFSTSLYVIRAGHMQPFFRTLEAIGAPVGQLLEELGLRQSQFADPDNFIPEYLLWRFADRAATIYGIEDLGFRVSERHSPAEFGAFGARLLCARNLLEAVKYFTDNLDQHSNCLNYWLEEDDEYLWVCRPGVPKLEAGSWVMEQHVLSFLIQVVRFYVAHEWTPALVNLQVSEPRGVEQSNSLMHSKLILDRPYSALAIEKPLLAARPPKRHEFDRKLPGDAPIGFAATVKVLLRQQFFGRNPNVQAVADGVGLNRRTLQRQLKQHDTTIRKMIEEVKFELARHLLCGTVQSNEQIARDLGYYDLRCFARAFKRWSGMTPAQYRRAKAA